MINKNKLGLTLGIFIAFLHLLWSLFVAVGMAQKYLDWIFPMHFISAIFSVTTFTIVNALILTVIAFIAGYVCGWLLGLVWNWLNKGE